MLRRLLIATLIVAASLFLLLVLLRSVEDTVSAQVLPPSKWDARILELDRQALDHAYQTQVEHVFGVWMRDEQGQPERAIRGARQARRAYIEVMTEFERRGLALH